MEKDSRKVIKVNKEAHKLLKYYCNNNGLKMSWFIDKLIKENCKEEK